MKLKLNAGLTPLLPGGSRITNAYDANARLLATKLLDSGSVDLDSYTYTYNQANQRTQVTRTAGDYVSYGYDNMGELISAKGKEAGGVTNRWQEQFGYAYDAAGNLNWRTNNTLLQRFNVNTLNQLTTVTNGGRLTVAGGTTGPATGVSVNTSNAFIYLDTAFASTNQPWASGVNTYTAIAQDSYARKDTNTVTVDLRATNSFAYDLNGNLLTDGRRNFAYDDENQLVSVWQTNVWRSDFKYDGKMRRRLTREYTWSSGWVLTNEVRSVYDGNLPVQERNGNHQPLATYTRGNDLSGTLQGAGGIGGLLARTANNPSADTNRLYVTGAGWSGANRVYVWNPTAGRYDGINQNYISTYANGGSTYWGLYYDTALFYFRPGLDADGAWSTVTGTWAHPPAPTVRYGTNLYATVYYHADGNGNVTALVAADGTVTGRYSYDAYGGLLTLSGVAAAANTQRFSSKEWCAKPGLYCYGYRFYDPNLQRWINRDPLEEFGGINLYQFVAGNPLAYFDPYGLDIFGYDNLGDYWDDVGNSLKGEGKGMLSNLTFGRYKPCYGSELEKSAGHFGEALATGAQLATGVGGLAKGLARGGFKQSVKGAYEKGRSMKWENIRDRMLNRDLVKPNEPVHHVFFHQASKVPDWIKNRPFNLMPITKEAHKSAHGGGPLDYLWHGTPQWFKKAVGGFGYAGGSHGARAFNGDEDNGSGERTCY